MTSHKAETKSTGKPDKWPSISIITRVDEWHHGVGTQCTDRRASVRKTVRLHYSAVHPWPAERVHTHSGRNPALNCRGPWPAWTLMLSWSINLATFQAANHCCVAAHLCHATAWSRVWYSSRTQFILPASAHKLQPLEQPFHSSTLDQFCRYLQQQMMTGLPRSAKHSANEQSTGTVFSGSKTEVKRNF